MGVDTIVGVIAVLAFGAGLWQYWEAQKWKQAEFAAGQLQRLSSEPALAACCRILDWRCRVLPIPEQYRSSSAEYSFQHDWTQLEEGLKPESVRGSFNRVQELYRDLFDEFFVYLEQMEHFLAIGLVKKHHLSSLRYWLEQLASPRFSQTQVFLGFLRYYGYTGVIRLMQRSEIIVAAPNRPLQPTAPHGGT